MGDDWWPTVLSKRPYLFLEAEKRSPVGIIIIIIAIHAALWYGIVVRFARCCPIPCCPHAVSPFLADAVASHVLPSPANPPFFVTVTIITTCTSTVFIAVTSGVLPLGVSVCWPHPPNRNLHKGIHDRKRINHLTCGSGGNLCHSVHVADTCIHYYRGMFFQVASSSAPSSASALWGYSSRVIWGTATSGSCPNLSGARSRSSCIPDSGRPTSSSPNCKPSSLASAAFLNILPN